MLSDIQIANGCRMLPIEEIAEGAGIERSAIECYGKYKAKITWEYIHQSMSRPEGRLILVTAINPTPAGEGKTTVSIGLSDALSRLGEKTMIALREPSLGPVFGMKGGAAGGGYAQIVPMDDINLHFTGDFHAIAAANNLLCAMLDNHMHQGNSLRIDPRRLTLRRCVDMNDRQLRNIVTGLGKRANGVVREDGFDITVASEVMAVFCLSSSIEELKARLSAIIVGYNLDGDPVTCGDLKAQGAMAALLKDALKPNLVQTLERTPALIHGGPFANIAHGCNSLIATRFALRHADYVVTEAGFGADLGAEKFVDIKCRLGGLTPSACVIVATVRALKHHGGRSHKDPGEDLEALRRGLPNLIKHVKNVTEVYKIPAVVAINRFSADSDAELRCVSEACAGFGVNVCLTEVWEKGGVGGEDLAREVLRISREDRGFSYVYPLELGIKDKINAIVSRVYGGKRAVFIHDAQKEIETLERLGFGNLPVCMAKTQYSLSDDPKKTGCPEGFEIEIKNVRVSAGAGFIVAMTGEIMTMPGLPRVPSAEMIDVDNDGLISGLF